MSSSRIEVPTVEPVDVILRDGATLRLRPPAADDLELLVSFFAGLSTRSRLLRFHGYAEAGERFARTLLEPDWDERGALLAAVEDDGVERVVAVGNYVRLRDRTSAEAAFAVTDADQQRGIGTRLIERLAARAAETGIERFVAEVLPENNLMLGVFEKVGFRLTRTLEQGVVEVIFPIAPTETYTARVDERDHVAVSASLQPFFRPRSLAVIGASPRRGSIGGELFRNVLAGDFTGAAYPINRTGEPVGGVKAYGSIDEVPDVLDLAVICVPGEHVLPAADAALRHGVRALCVISAGFAETGPEGRVRQDALLAQVRAHGARLVGPNCLGLASTATRLNATFAPRAFPPGRIGFSSQSGALGLALLERAEARDLGVSAFVSIGNKADVSSNDLLEWWEDDSDTDLVLLYVESFGNPRKFGRLARRVSRVKPILAMKSGRSQAGRRAAGSHTAALAGSDAAVDALFHQAGVLRAETLAELLDVAALLSSQPAPRGGHVAVITNAGGLGILCADACERAGLELPPLSERTQSRLGEILPAEASVTNPVDMLGSATDVHYGNVLPVVLDDPAIDAVIALFVPPVAVDIHAVGTAISRAAAGTEKPVLASIVAAEGAPPTLRSVAHVPAFAYPEGAARALGRAVERSTWLRRSAGVVPVLADLNHPVAEAVVDRALAASPDAWLDPVATRELLQAYGLPLVEERVCGTPGEAAAAAVEIGFPVVLKLAGAGTHKTERGGVVLNLGDRGEVTEAAERLAAPVIVQPYVRGGAEFLAGVVHDPVFGPLVAFGPGGVQAELIGGTEFRLSPLTDEDSRELVTTGKAGTIAAGFRGAAPVDVDALEDILHRLSRLADDHPAVAELDLNPVLALPERVLIVDARIRIAQPSPPPDLKSW